MEATYNNTPTVSLIHFCLFATPKVYYKLLNENL